MKLRKFLLMLPVTLLGAVSLAGCSNNKEVRVLRILNAEDYIYEFSEDEDLDYATELSDAEFNAMSKEEQDEFITRYKNNYRMDMVDQFKEYWLSASLTRQKSSQTIVTPSSASSALVTKRAYMPPPSNQ